MPMISVRELAEATGGTILRGDPETRLGAFVIDSRRIEDRAAFFALLGARDGHEFVADAAKRGAAAAVVSRQPTDDGNYPPAVIRVPDTTAALARAGSWVRRRLDGARFVAVTGSTGKTTTKELIAAALAVEHRVHRSPGNLNNHLGVPLALLACPDEVDFVVLELGMSAPGEIARLMEIGVPDVALVTNVRPAHLASFRDLDDIAAAKGEMFAVLAETATAVVNLDDPHVRLQSNRHDGPRVTFGRASGADFRLEHVEDRLLGGAEFRFRHAGGSHHARLRLVGAHSALNGLAAVATAYAAGVDPAVAVRGIETVEAAPGRGVLHRLANGVHVLDDSYNSNPAAMASILETLKREHPEGRKVLVMGDMLELGKGAKTFHHDLGRKAAAAGVDVMIGVGPLSRHALESARRGGVGEVHHEKEAGGAARYLSGHLRPGDLVVVKGSRGIGLDRLVDELVRQAPEGPA